MSANKQDLRLKMIQPIFLSSLGFEFTFRNKTVYFKVKDSNNVVVEGQQAGNNFDGGEHYGETLGPALTVRTGPHNLVSSSNSQGYPTQLEKSEKSCH